MSALIALALKGLSDPKIWIGAVFAGLLAFAAVQSARLNHAKADQIDPATHRPWKTEAAEDHAALAIADANLATCHASLAALQNGLAAQTASLAALKARGDADSAAAAKAAQGAAVALQSADREAAKVLATKAGADRCAAAEQLILDSLGSH